MPLTIFYANPRGIRSKTHSLHTELEQIKPDVLVIVETQLTRNYTIKIEGYDQQATRSRDTKGGGILVATRNNTNIDMVITEINETHEQMTANIDITLILKVETF